MFALSNKTDYAFLFLEYLSRHDNAVPLSKFVADQGIPRRFMAQIASRLVRAQLVSSKEGISGGYTLKISPHKIPVYDVIRLFEGDLTVVKCNKKDFRCRYKIVCCHGDFFKDKLSKKLIKTLNGLTLKDVIAK
ncbi:hypothetical protein A3J15_02975 [Candidatus Roizmanbacteria bacterium RIFCSPLOWO2_02_FULL_38_10]|uniref:Rrf2 family transcriptional regulator n=1 Tax=Candidatus Roizmanbacteria bacterium RIFCSPLOWO2_02_FULL_38_10 TaxID=1802074 RepID=A0A1F7JME1_9BACT|nr:MAG: hypothetical protein A3J15_02975 [Candidatus Roizmanbacteria bacterium RIFCSPLOWO2_02_FULL_38_10]